MVGFNPSRCVQCASTHFDDGPEVLHDPQRSLVRDRPREPYKIRIGHTERKTVDR